MPGERSHWYPTAPAVTCLLRPQRLTRVYAFLWGGRSRQSPSALQRSRANIEDVPRRWATLVVQLFRMETRGRDRAPAMPAKHSKYNILQHYLWNTALLRQNFHINSPYGRRDEHPLQGGCKEYVKNVQYNQAFGVTGVVVAMMLVPLSHR